jgi:multiple sugar transport system ATP-binding protein
VADVRLDRVSKRFGATEVIPPLSLAIARGEFVVLVGPSGCGKSTLLRMIAGLEEITAGDLFIAERRMNEVPPQRRDIAMVFQSYALFPNMTVAGNIGFGPRVRGAGAGETARLVGEAAGVLTLSAFLDRRPGQLSGGQRQRVAMGRALVRDPTVFLFDEPLSNLDAKLRLQMRTEIKALHQKLRSTIVYVTHDQIEAMTMADRIVVMNAGRIEQEGPPLELYDRPATRFVAGFLGSPAMSFLAGAYAHGPDGPRVVLGAGVAAPVAAAGLPEGAAVELGVRPERFAVGGPSPLPLAVEVVEPTGAETHVFGRIAGAPVRAVFRERLAPAPGETLPVSVAPADAYVFDRETGRRLAGGEGPR